MFKQIRSSKPTSKGSWQLLHMQIGMPLELFMGLEFPM
jgi:hypothetical protein